MMDDRDGGGCEQRSYGYEDREETAVK